MTNTQWQAFCAYRDQLKALCDSWSSFAGELAPLQRQAAEKDTPAYPLETAVVYNSAYDELTPQDEIKLIVIGDNPGKEEQLASKRRYLVGQSGRVAEGFFRRNQELGIDFRRNVIIMNKTPVHTAKTAHLRFLLANGSEGIKNLILQSQLTMAELAATLHQKLGSAELWLVGYAELKGKGIFLPYRDKLKEAYAKNPESWQRVCVYQHFSMNCFLIDLKKHRMEGEGLAVALHRIGSEHRKDIFGS